MKKLFSFIIIFIFVSQAFSQEFITGIVSNPVIKKYLENNNNHYRKKAVDTIITLPFYDDFSFSSVFPADSLWEDRFVFVNSTFGINPPSVGMATFDAINDSGSIYPNATPTPFEADFLTSRHVRLDSSFHIISQKLDPSDSLYLSFYYQPQGNGNYPNPGDSLILQFASFPPDTSIILVDTTGGIWKYDTIISTHWNTVWASPGMTYSTFFSKYNKYFRQVLIPVKDSRYFFKEFQFRFKNKASIANNIIPSWQSNMDIWNIDYVYLNLNRSKIDTVYQDITFVDPAPTILKNYQLMPIKQFSNTELKDTLKMKESNLYNQVTNISYKYDVKELGGSFFYNHNGGVMDIYPFITNGFHNWPYHTKPTVDFTLPAMSGDSAKFEIKHYLGLTSGWTDKNYYNDTLRFFQNFNNFYAYDDGTAEAGYGLAGIYSKLAYAFTLNQPDTLGAVDIFFNQTLTSPDTRYFKLTVWSSVNPEVIVYQSSRVHPEYEMELNKFHRYTIDDALLVLGAGTFFVGWQQSSDENLNVGFDMNTNSATKLWYNSEGIWSNTSFIGSLMLRPVMGLNVSQKKKLIEKQMTEVLSCKIYPNPAHYGSLLKLEVPQKYLGVDYYDSMIIEIYNNIGARVLSLKFNQEVDLSTLDRGLYMIRVTCLKTGEFFSDKFVYAK
jgi:hypothetical protein